MTAKPWGGALELWGQYASPAIDSIGDANEIEVVTKADFVAAVTEARRAAFEEACKAECLYCRENAPILVGLDGAWHRDGLGEIKQCHAAAIRAKVEGE
jgi:hypothetical protein